MRYKTRKIWSAILPKKYLSSMDMMDLCMETQWIAKYINTMLAEFRISVSFYAVWWCNTKNQGGIWLCVEWRMHLKVIKSLTILSKRMSITSIAADLWNLLMYADMQGLLKNISYQPRILRLKLCKNLLSSPNINWFYGPFHYEGMGHFLPKSVKAL